MNLVLLSVGLIILMSAQCDQSSSGDLLDQFIIPSELHLPKSVLDLEHEKNQQSKSKKKNKTK